MVFDKLFHQPLYYYNIFYTIAILCCTGLLIAEGYRRKFQPVPYALIVVSGMLAFILGCHLITFSSEDWLRILSNQSLERRTGLSVLGGIFLSTPFLLLFKRLYGFKADLLDAYAYILPLGMCVQRVGCFLAGCCYGTPTESLFGVRYPKFFPVFQVHDSAHLLSAEATHALPIHPVQLYEAAGCAAAFLVIYLAPRFLRATGNLFLLSGVSYYTVRFFTEFVREPLAHSFGGIMNGGINTVQWIMLFLIAASLIIICYRERKIKTASSVAVTDLSQWHVVHYTLLLLIFILSAKWLTTLENYLFMFFLAGMGIKLMLAFYTQYIALPKFTYGTISLSLLALIMMSQTTSESSEKKVTETYNTVSFGYLFGNFDGRTKIDEVVSGSDCSGDPVTIPIYASFEEKFSAGNIGISQTWKKDDNNKLTVGLNTYVSRMKETMRITYDQYGDSEILANRSTTFTGFNPFVTYDTRYISLTGGVHVGKLYRLKTKYEDKTASEPTLFSETAVLPQFGFRFGNISGPFATFRVYDHSVAALPAIPVQLGIGYGFLKTDGTHLELGVSSFSTIYLSSNIPLSENVFIKPYLGFGGGAFNHFEDSKDGFIGSIGLSTHFNRKQKN